MIEVVEKLFGQYGYLVLLIGIPLDFIALPIPPGNSTLTYAGYLSSKEVLLGWQAIVMAFIGSITGVTITYWLGYRVGMPLIERYGRWILLKPELVEKTRRYYEKYGDRLLLISFFIPGVRQFIGYFIGIIRVPYRSVWMYAYTGVALWVVLFFSIGYFFGEQWQVLFEVVERYIKLILIGLAVAAAAFGLLKLRSKRRRQRQRGEGVSIRKS